MRTGYPGRAGRAGRAGGAGGGGSNIFLLLGLSPYNEH